MKTAFETKCKILADIWGGDYPDESLDDFREVNDVSLPLAFGIVHGYIGRLNTSGRQQIESTYTELLDMLEIPDTRYNSLDELLMSSR